MRSDQITQVRVRGMRTVEDVTVDLSGLTVLIGENGSGKSTLLDAFELLRLAAESTSFLLEVAVRWPGGLQDLLRHGSSELSIEVAIAGGGPELVYGFALGLTGGAGSIKRERLSVDLNPDDPHFISFDREGARVQLRGAVDPLPGDAVNSETLALPLLASSTRPPLPVKRITAALRAIDFRLPLLSRRASHQPRPDLQASPLQPSSRERAHDVSRFVAYLASSLQEVKNRGEPAWTDAINSARAVLGVRDLFITATEGGAVLEVSFGAHPDEKVPARALSEGQLNYLLWIALLKLEPSRSVLVVDEPELHLHPGAVPSVAWMLEEIARTHPVVVATHSDRFLDALESPAESVVLCELDLNGVTRLKRPNPERLVKWLERYNGLGSLRAEGYEPHVFDLDDEK